MPMSNNYRDANKGYEDKIPYPSLNLIFADYDINRGFLSESYSFRA